jgi:hypothetical protein
VIQQLVDIITKLPLLRATTHTGSAYPSLTAETHMGGTQFCPVVAEAFSDVKRTAARIVANRSDPLLASSSLV